MGPRAFSLPTLIVIALHLLGPAPACVAQADSVTAAPDTSSFALVLNGGGARGLAHISVLKELEALGMRPGLIVGTSMGAVIGSLYASGMSAAELEQMATERQWLKLFVDNESAPAEMQGGWWGLPPHQLTLQLDQFPPMPPAGITYGQAIETLVGGSTADALFAADNDFDRLPIPFRCVTVDLMESTMQVYGDGALPRVVKASGTIPIIFYPVEYDGRLLVDGGFLENTPLSVARDLGFSRAVVVDVSNVNLPKTQTPDNVYALWIRVTELGQVTSNEIDATEADVVLTMPLEDYRSLSFGSARQILEIGDRVAEEHRPELIELREACGPAALGPPPEPPQVGSVVLRRVEAEGQQKMSGSRVLKEFGLRPGQRVTLQQAWGAADRMAREGSFYNAWLSIEPVAPDSADVVVHVLERSDVTLEVGAHVITDDPIAVFGRLRGDNFFGWGAARALSYRYSSREARLDAVAEHSQGGPGPLAVIGRFHWRRERPWIYDEGEKVDRWVFRRTQLGLDLAARLRGLGWTLFVGGDGGQVNTYDEERLLSGSGDVDLWEFHVALESHVLESLLSRQLRGVRFRYTRSLGWGTAPDYWRFELGAVLPWPRHRRWRPVAAGGLVTSSTDIPPIQQGRAGSPQGWVGLRLEEIIAPEILWGRLGLEYFLSDALYAQLVGAVGWHGQRSLNESKPIWGGGLEMGMDSPVGPLRLRYALASRRKGYIYVQIGYRF